MVSVDNLGYNILRIKIKIQKTFQISYVYINNITKELKYFLNHTIHGIFLHKSL